MSTKLEKFLEPKTLDILPHTTAGEDHYIHWKKTLQNFLGLLTFTTASAETDKLTVLTNHVSPAVYKLIAKSTTYMQAITTLDSTFTTVRNEHFSRYKLLSVKQKQESLNEFITVVEKLSLDCTFAARSVEQCADDLKLQALIQGVSSDVVRQRLLEQKDLTYSSAIATARAVANSLSQASTIQEYHHNSNTDYGPSHQSETLVAAMHKGPYQGQSGVKPNRSCWFCGGRIHPRATCPAKSATCNFCQKTGHFETVCIMKKNSKSRSTTAAVFPATAPDNMPSTSTESNPVLATLLLNQEGKHLSLSKGAPSCLGQAILDVEIQSRKYKALLDTGSSESYIDARLAQTLGLHLVRDSCTVSMAVNGLDREITHSCQVRLLLYGKSYIQTFKLITNLCTDFLLGQDFLKTHKSLTIEFGGPLPGLSAPTTMDTSNTSHSHDHVSCQINLHASSLPPAEVFTSLTANCRPIATKSRKFSMDDRKFIDSEIKGLLDSGKIEPSNSPWRAQVLVTSGKIHKKRLVIDYSQTINRFTELDAYPFPHIDQMAAEVARYHFFSTLDLKSAYHQICLRDEDKKYTAFQANDRLYQFCVLPFGLTNAVATFQRSMDQLVERENLKDTFVYVDNITVCGMTQKEHDDNLRAFLSAAKRANLTFNEKKCVYNTLVVTMLGYRISHGQIQPDPERLRPLKELKIPQDVKSLKHILGLFSYYSRWIPHYSDKIQPLLKCVKFPPSDAQVSCLKQLTKDIENAVLQGIKPGIPLVVETDASDVAISAVLNQEGRPIAFFARTLDPTERKHASVEKEAYAIVEALRQWRHLLLGHKFTLITDQKSVQFMFNQDNLGKIKNDKIQRWRIELAQFRYNIQYRPGTENLPADALSRLCAIRQDSLRELRELHSDLCHPGATRLAHYVRMKNKPFSEEEVRKITRDCPICCEIKPQFYKPVNAHLIRSTEPMERLNVDFKGPLPSNSRNKFLLTVVDEYSRFTFAFPVPDTTARSVIKCLNSIFSVFGTCSFVHSDRGAAFISSELRSYLLSKNIAVSTTTPYNPRCNGQCERYNGVLWKSIELALKSKNLPISSWESVLPDILHAQRSLLCTATSETPHDRMFKFQRRSSSGISLPVWLSKPGKVLLRKFVRNSKYEPSVIEVDLVQANPNYALIRYPDGRESTVSSRDLAPRGTFQPILANDNHHCTNDMISVPLVAEKPTNYNNRSNSMDYWYANNPVLEPMDSITLSPANANAGTVNDANSVVPRMSLDGSSTPEHSVHNYSAPVGRETPIPSVRQSSRIVTKPERFTDPNFVYS